MVRGVEKFKAYLKEYTDLKEDVKEFVEITKHNPMDLRSLGMRNVVYEDLLEVIKRCYNIE